LKFHIEPLTKRHDRSHFTCGDPYLDDWFRRRASQDAKRDVARVFVAVEPDHGAIGFYSLSAFSLSLDDMPEDLARRLPRYEAIPAALVGRLATDLRVRGRGIGKLLLADAIRRILSATDRIAVFGIVVDAKTEDAVQFYEQFGFRRFPAHPLRLFLPTQTAMAALGS
jgi:GNAT superfamily N-acetyltransferase